MAPRVLSAYALPTSWPTESSAPAATRTVSGKTPPIRMVAGNTVMQASTNWQTRMASTPKLDDCSSHVNT